MASGDLQRIFRALGDAGVRYLVVGGVAVVLHGHPRFTADLDLVVSLQPANVLAALRALGALGYRPRAPVPAEAFADPETRASWVREKGLTVFSLWSATAPLTEVDLFVEEPFDFEAVYSRALRAVVGGTEISVPGLDDLLSMKRAAGRPKDLEDVLALEEIRGSRRDDV